MVAKIETGKSIRGILYYNENKVSSGEAQLILASCFAGEIENMTFQNKLQRFQNLMNTTPTIKTNAVHISLNFHSSENIANAKMQEIALEYMERIGFGDQPYLVYRHNDSGHPHFHIVTTNVQKNGNGISLHNIGKNVSEPARKSIERDFKLVVAENKDLNLISEISPVNIKKALYGKLSTKRQISNVISHIVKKYKFTSLSELNAVLKGFNVVAYKGEPGTAMFNNMGLMYSLIDDKGQEIGIPIKSSSFYSKPTLRNLEILFTENKQKRQPLKADLVKRINQVLFKFQSITKNTLRDALKKEGIDIVIIQNEHGRIYGVTFIDHIHKSVFKGSDLGKNYSANAFTERIGTADQLKSYLLPSTKQYTYLKSEHKAPSVQKNPAQSANDLIDILLQKNENDFMPTFARKRRKKKRNQGLTL